MARRQMLQQQIDTQWHESDLLWRAHLESRESIAAAFKEIREDVDRNYGHTHEGHVLARIAHEIEHARGAIQPDALLARDIVDAEGARFIVDDRLSYGAALAFAWQFGRRAGRLYLRGPSLEVATRALGTLSANVTMWSP